MGSRLPTSAALLLDAAGDPTIPIVYTVRSHERDDGRLTCVDGRWGLIGIGLVLVAAGAGLVVVTTRRHRALRP
ncbi:MAG TPA: hypothetical protein VFN21_02700 [Acidimicrobiales bacterium]|nr:hypothetical protein [Acidimicrobiales bacterium]